MHFGPIWCALLAMAYSMSAPVNAASNLAPNPGFEVATWCPTALEVPFGQIHFAEPWARAGQSPDYFHSCSTSPDVDMPDNAPGWQMSNTVSAGSTTPYGGYAGIATWTRNCADCREYLQVRLTGSLRCGVNYRASFYVSLADESLYAIDQLGAYVSSGSLMPIDGGVLPYTPQVESVGPPIDDMINWVLITGKFLAAGGEDNIAIGNFRKDQELTVVPVAGDGNSTHAYYYIDDVAVEKADITDMKDPSAAPDPAGMLTVAMTGATPGSRAVLYGGAELTTSQIDGHTFDLGPAAYPLAETTVDRSGVAHFRWPWQLSAGLADPQTGVLYLEAATYDPNEGLVDSDEAKLVLPAGKR